MDENNKLQDVNMGSYGIGVGRTMAALAEQYSSENSLSWPDVVAPYKVAIVIIRMTIISLYFKSIFHSSFSFTSLTTTPFSLRTSASFPLTETVFISEPKRSSKLLSPPVTFI